MDNFKTKNFDDGVTHFEGCWREGTPDHFFCALEVLKDLLTVIPNNYKKLFELLDSKRVIGFKNKSTSKIISHINYLTKEYEDS